jgi:hypothetical protein
LIATISRVTRIPLLALFFVSAVDFSLDSARIDLVLMTAALAILLWGGIAEPLTVGRRIAVRFGRSPPPLRRVARRIARPAKTSDHGSAWDSRWRCDHPGRQCAADMRILYLTETPGLPRHQVVLESELVTNPKLLTEPESIELLDRLAPDWQIRLHDDAVIDHILKVIGRPRKD